MELSDILWIFAWLFALSFSCFVIITFVHDAYGRRQSSCLCSSFSTTSTISSSSSKEFDPDILCYGISQSLTSPRYPNRWITAPSFEDTSTCITPQPRHDSLTVVYPCRSFSSEKASTSRYDSRDISLLSPSVTSWNETKENFKVNRGNKMIPTDCSETWYSHWEVYDNYSLDLHDWQVMPAPLTEETKTPKVTRQELTTTEVTQQSKVFLPTDLNADSGRAGGLRSILKKPGSISHSKRSVTFDEFAHVKTIPPRYMLSSVPCEPPKHESIT